MIKINPAMARALKLTRAGKLNAATRVIQNSLTRNMAKGMSPTVPGTLKRAPALPGKQIQATVKALQRALPSAPAAPKTRKPSPTAPASKAPKPRKTQGQGSFAQCRYTGPEGSLDYWLYLPARPLQGLPVVVMLHGCTQTPGDFARGTGMNALAEEHGLIVAYPAQPSSANFNRCWNWFRPGDQQRDSGEPALIAAMTRSIVADTDADAARVYVAGLSAGGAAAAIMGAAYPDVYAAIGVHSGLACGAASDMMSAFSAMRSGPGHARPSPRTGRFVPVITFHGDSDSTVHAVNSARIIADAADHIAAPLTVKSERGSTATGRTFTRETSHSADGAVQIEQWTIHGAGHAWSGGNHTGTYTDATGPDASRALIAFFLEHRMPH